MENSENKYSEIIAKFKKKIKNFQETDSSEDSVDVPVDSFKSIATPEEIAEWDSMVKSLGIGEGQA